MKMVRSNLPGLTRASSKESTLLVAPITNTLSLRLKPSSSHSSCSRPCSRSAVPLSVGPLPRALPIASISSAWQLPSHCKRKEKLFDHSKSLIRRQPGNMTIGSNPKTCQVNHSSYLKYRSEQCVLVCRSLRPDTTRCITSLHTPTLRSYNWQKHQCSRLLYRSG